MVDAVYLTAIRGQRVEQSSRRKQFLRCHGQNIPIILRCAVWFAGKPVFCYRLTQGEGKMKMLRSTLAGLLMTSTALTTSVSAQSSAPVSAPFLIEGSSSSSAPGAFWLIPAAIALGYGFTFGDFEMEDVASLEVLSGGSNGYYDIILYWTLASTLAAATFLQAGYYLHENDVSRVTQTSGAVFNTNGYMRERGFFIGLAVYAYLNGLFRGDSIEVRRASSNAEPGGIALTGALSLGHGSQEFSAFGGGFTGTQDNNFVRAELGLDIPIGRPNDDMTISLSPGLVYTKYDGGVISADNLVGVLRLKFEF